jgi:hypothetical protein
MTEAFDPRFIIILVFAFVVVLVLLKPGGRRHSYTCRQCGATHPKFARFCRRCGQRL